MSERDNRMLWDGRPLHYEVWWLTLNHRASGVGFWIRYLVESPRLGEGDAYAQLWLSRFDPADPERNFGRSRRFPAVQLSAIADPFALRIGEAVLRHDGASGGFASGGREVSWNLAWRPGFVTHRHFGDLLYRLPIADTRLLSPNPDLALRGDITIDGERYTFDGDPGQQSHVWGRKHTYQHAWGHCNAFEGAPGAVLSATAGRIKRGQVILPRLTLFTLYLDGEVIAFREPWTLPLARSDWGTGFFQMLGAGPEVRVEARFSCRADDMLLAEYLDPDGDPAFNHITTVADVEVEVKRRSSLFGRWRDQRTLRARRTGAFEWLGRAGDVGRVRRAVVQE